MSDFFSNAPNIIKEASQSPLGVFSLMILVLAVLGALFFRAASELTRVVIFVLMFLGVASFGVSLSLVKPKEVPGPALTSVPTLQPPPAEPKRADSPMRERSESVVRPKEVVEPRRTPVLTPEKSAVTPKSAATPSVPRATHYTVSTSSDNSTVILKMSSGDEERHIALGQDRVQKIFTAADEKWSLVVFKLRGQSQYRAFAINLITGSSQEDTQVPIPSVPEAVNFEKREVVMSFRGGESQRLPLHN